ncbi:lytic transglycosylase domain-containing protein [Limnochorda pilosa]|uniref:lytic transglycosylase domain-containing protein n=1 Tax=Limnochorda pilosa TaxID=1555112 RepID=UPI001D205E25|nr:lytic transglycosylase domain-containing protein [Limnochorda pilosa]MBO2486795.1 hypothetical protein [Bacillota bacterium]
MQRLGRIRLVWSLLLVLCLLAGREFVANRRLLQDYQNLLAESQALLEAQQAELNAQQAELAARQAELDARQAELESLLDEVQQLRATLEATEQRLREYEAYYERIRPIAAALRSARGADPWAIAAQIERSSRRWGVDPWLVVAVGFAESSWNVHARGRAGEVGPMQVMPATYRAMGGKHLGDWRENIDVGTRYLALMLDHAQGDVRLAVAYYNAGPSRPAAVVRQISARHVERVMQYRYLL